MKKIKIIFNSVIILTSISLAVEDESEKNINYQFINNIYSESWALIIGINKYQNMFQLLDVNDLEKYFHDQSGMDLPYANEDFMEVDVYKYFSARTFLGISTFSLMTWILVIG